MMGHTQEQRVATLIEVSALLGRICQDPSKWKKELSHEMWSRLVNRHGQKIYQAATFKISHFPLSLAEELFPEEPSARSDQEVVWEYTTEIAVTRMMRGLTEAGGSQFGWYSAGATRAYKTKSERVVRVMGRVMSPVEIRLVHPQGDSAELCVSYTYCLMRHCGTLYPPKGPDCREMALDSAKDEAIRQEIFADALAMGEAGVPLSPQWWRKLGREDKAVEAESEMNARGVKRGRKPRKRLGQSAARQNRLLQLRARSSSEAFDIDRILAERKVNGKDRMRYLVRWTGYDSTWEEYRKGQMPPASQEPGTPLETWEPLRLVVRTEALQEWKETLRLQ